jgi:hypothetical protein
MTQLHRNDKLDWKKVWNTQSVVHIFFGAALAVLAMKGFMIPNRFLDGGILHPDT